MSLRYILEKIGYKVGLNPQDSDERKVLLRFVNEAAPQVYSLSDMAGCLEEQYFQIQSNQTIALPEYVGQLRAMREADTQIALKLSQMRPRYNQFNWADEWRDWRIKGQFPLQTSVKNQSLLVLTVKAVENPPIEVTISGPIEGAARVSEIVIMDAMIKNTTNNFLDVAAITKSNRSAYNVIVSDVDGNQLSYIANDQLKALFQIVDISTAPWSPSPANPLCNWVEVLYKRTLPYLSDDGDEFPVPGYDDIVVYKSLQLWFEEQSNIQVALAYQMKCVQLIAQIHEDANRGTADTISMVANPHDEINPRVGFGRDYRWAYRINGR